MRFKYTDFDGADHEIEADVSIETKRTRSSINSRLEWEETVVVFRVDGRIISRESLDYREAMSDG